MKQDEYLSLLGLALRGGYLAVGTDAAESAVHAKAARALLVSADASERTLRNAEFLSERGQCLLLTLPCTETELGHSLGRGATAIAALTNLGLAGTLTRRLAALDPERYTSAMERIALKMHRSAERQEIRRKNGQQKTRRNSGSGETRRDTDTGKTRRTTERRGKYKNKQTTDHADRKQSVSRHNRSRNMEKPYRTFDDARHKPEDFRRKSDGARHKPEDFRRKSDDARHKPEDFRRKSDDARRKPEHFQRKSDDARHKPEDFQRKSDDFRRKPHSDLRPRARPVKKGRKPLS